MSGTIVSNMKKPVLLFIGIGFAIAVAGYILVLPVRNGKNPKENSIGGQRDEHGCLVPAGYTWDEDIGACTRNWDIGDTERDGAKLAVSSVGRKEGLTVVAVTVESCAGCYRVELSNNGDIRKIVIENFEIKETSSPSGETVFVHTANADSVIRSLAKSFIGADPDYITLDPIDVLWNTKDGEKNYPGVHFLYTDAYGSDSISQLHRNILTALNNSKFETDPYNAFSSTPQQDMTRVRRDRIICNLVKTVDNNNSETNLDIRCSDISE